ncbi:hypothetical protein [Aureivirga sp. CE67]|uniref:hypothetical protein n=1 Tax=Aureivirga sp. CE67 TaxID=1788983 RepID=UPI0018CBC43D|nr:hypothetical protein [Aureivirga sp. CE67]
MKKYYFLFSFLAVLLSFLSCEKSKPLKINGYGNLKKDSLSVALNLEDFSSFNELLNKIDSVFCTDSVPKIVFENKGELKSIIPYGACSQIRKPFLLKLKNTIQISNDSIFKYYDYLFPLDSLKIIMRKDLLNNEEDERYCQSPKKYLIWVHVDEENLQDLSKTLDVLTEIYEEIMNDKNIQIEFDIFDKVPIPPPPPQLLSDF